eukprot:7376049-Prymnesium_polylepis.2
MAVAVQTIGGAICSGRRSSHLSGLEHETTRSVEKSKMKLNGQISVTHIQADALRTRKPSWYWAHILAGKPKPKREGTEEARFGAPLHDAHVRWWVGSQADDRGRRRLSFCEVLALDHARR